MRMDDREYFDWIQGATDVEMQLHDRFYDFSELFEDMLFERDTVPYNLIRCQSLVSGEDVEQEELVDDDFLRPDELSCFSYNYFKTKVKKQSGCNGYYNRDEQLLCVTPEAIDDDVTILHEMIHLHESVINELPFHFHDVLYWALYQDLRKKIANLDDAISCHAHILNEFELYSRGGLHDILFLLKSFDLDIRLGYPFGTVFGYGRVDEFKYLKMI